MQILWDTLIREDLKQECAADKSRGYLLQPTASFKKSLISPWKMRATVIRKTARLDYMALGHSGILQTRLDDGFDEPDLSKCGAWTSYCALSDCLDREFANYPDPSYYSLLGPNSNTFASTLASRCGLTKPSVPWSTPG